MLGGGRRYEEIHFNWETVSQWVFDNCGLLCLFLLILTLWFWCCLRLRMALFPRSEYYPAVSVEAEKTIGKDLVVMSYCVIFMGMPILLIFLSPLFLMLSYEKNLPVIFLVIWLTAGAVWWFYWKRSKKILGQVEDKSVFSVKLLRQLPINAGIVWLVQPLFFYLIDKYPCSFMRSFLCILLLTAMLAPIIYHMALSRLFVASPHYYTGSTLSEFNIGDGIGCYRHRKMRWLLALMIYVMPAIIIYAIVIVFILSMFAPQVVIICRLGGG